MRSNITTKIISIENAIVKAFKLSIEDFYVNRIEIEEDFRACFYFHLRSFLGDKDDVQILLDHLIDNKKPDIIIRRRGVYLIAIELKNLNKVNDTYRDFVVKDGQKDVNKIQALSSSFKRGFFIYFTKREKNFALRKTKWKNGYYREMWHILDKPSIHVKRECSLNCVI